MFVTNKCPETDETCTNETLYNTKYLIKLHVFNRLSVQSVWVLFIDETFQDGISPFPMKEKSSVKDWCANMTYTVGIGRHTEEEVHEMTAANLRTFSDILGI